MQLKELPLAFEWKAKAHRYLLFTVLKSYCIYGFVRTILI